MVIQIKNKVKTQGRLNYQGRSFLYTTGKYKTYIYGISDGVLESNLSIGEGFNNKKNYDKINNR